MILILGVWIYNDIILRPIFRNMLPRLLNEVSKHDGETKHGQDFEESYGDISKSVVENIHGLWKLLFFGTVTWTCTKMPLEASLHPAWTPPIQCMCPYPASAPLLHSPDTPTPLLPMTRLMPRLRLMLTTDTMAMDSDTGTDTIDTWLWIP